MSASKPQRQAALWAQVFTLYYEVYLFPIISGNNQYMGKGLGVNGYINRGDFYPGETTYWG
jgi:hypothetical protein